MRLKFIQQNIKVFAKNDNDRMSLLTGFFSRIMCEQRKLLRTVIYTKRKAILTVLTDESGVRRIVSSIDNY